MIIRPSLAVPQAFATCRACLHPIGLLRPHPDRHIACHLQTYTKQPRHEASAQIAKNQASVTGKLCPTVNSFSCITHTAELSGNCSFADT
jgi:hypothetical protein